MSEIDNQRALIYILDDELVCLKADMITAVKKGHYETVLILRDLIQELLDARLILIEGEDDV